jgi:hypothetical protein
MSTFIGPVIEENNHGVHYHGFKVRGQVFSCLHYCTFTEPVSKKKFFGKIQSVFQDKHTHENMLEVSVFQYVPDCKKRVESDLYNELYMVVGNTMEIPISCVAPAEVSVLHVPHMITSENILSYVDVNIGKAEYTDDEESDMEDDDMDFIVNGDVFGWYQECIDAKTDIVKYAPPPKFVDKYMAFETVPQNERLEHEFTNYLFEEFLKPMMDCITVSEHVTRLEIFKCLLEERFYFEDLNTHPDKITFQCRMVSACVTCHKLRTQRLAAFIHLLKVMLQGTVIPAMVELYTFVCAGAGQSVPPTRKRSASDAVLDAADNNTGTEEWDSNDETSDDDDNYSVYSDED